MANQLTKPLLNAERLVTFGAIPYSPLSNGNIKVSSKWIKDNITNVHIPQLKNVKYAPSNCIIQWNSKCVKQIQVLFECWEELGIMDRVLTWQGAWVPRFVRGSATTLSNHAWGTAFDINAEYNGLGKGPAKLGEAGSVIDLVETANHCGFYWGGDFKRPDGMHFEIAEVIEDKYFI